MQNVSATATARPTTILVVEDDVFIRSLIAGVLRDLRMEVVEAATGDEAWAYLLSGAAVDLVFTDYNMPGTLSGMQLSELISNQLPDVRVVLTSARLEPGSYAGTFIAKPYDMLAVAQRLNSMLRKSDGSTP